ncbi:MAG: flavodoxin-dependent (E)-4-hydroxy-3-methylbut-2-enyl-diphosphate synthase, partial [Lentisphaerae bacterium]|nr:flavodoxin-dependent (E)-4-hydroxy-3-methylbut-2-enyl-diphosphate synthase [Lentisphaerota bacterium]
ADICRAVDLPLVADVHFDYRLALQALQAGVAGLRINPGNIGNRDRVREVARAAAQRGVPIRIGVNAGSLEKDILARHGAPTAAAMVESAQRHVRILEDQQFYDIKLSVKASDLTRTVQAYRRLAALTDYPLHLGVTEAGTLLAGAVRSSAALALLLADGIGDTIRISLTEHPLQEVRAAQALLRSLELAPPGPAVVACPTCGRVEIDAVSLAHRVEQALEKLAGEFPGAVWPVVAVMGCMVNGPGEAREADLAVVGGRGCVALYAAGRHQATMSEDEVLPELLRLVRCFLAQHPEKPGGAA